MKQRTIHPKNLNKKSHIRVIAPSRSGNIISKDTLKIAEERLKTICEKITYGKNVFDTKKLNSSSIENKVKDLHDAFENKDVDCILSMIGGFNSHEMLPAINYQLIQKNPKTICGFSDVTAILNAITHMTGLITFYGPHYSSRGMKKGFEFTEKTFKTMCYSKESQTLPISKYRSDDLRFIDQDKRVFIENKGMSIIQEGDATGQLFGGNLCTLNLLQGTKYMPNIKGSILFVEDTGDMKDNTIFYFRRNLISLLQESKGKIGGLLVGRFQKESNMKIKDIKTMLEDIKELKNVPIMANIDFGHTTPSLTLPIGGIASISTTHKTIKIIKTPLANHPLSPHTGQDVDTSL